MNGRAIRAIMRKDLKVTLQNKGVSIPLIVIPLLFFVGIPILAGFVPALANSEIGGSLNELQLLIDRMPAGLQSGLADYTPVQQIIVLMLVYLMAPMYLIVPLMVASVIAADSFAGEKERKTLEALLYTPTTDRELLLAKLLGAWVPAVAVGLIGFLLYSIVANVAAWPIMGGLFFPNAMWWALALWVGPAVAGLGLVVTVLISARAQGFQDAYQMGVIVVLPILLLVIGQATGVIYFSLALVLLLGLILWVLNVFLLYFGGRQFQRTTLLSRL